MLPVNVFSLQISEMPFSLGTQVDFISNRGLRSFLISTGLPLGVMEIAAVTTACELVSKVALGWLALESVSANRPIYLV